MGRRSRASKRIDASWLADPWRDQLQPVCSAAGCAFALLQHAFASAACTAAASRCPDLQFGNHGPSSRILAEVRAHLLDTSRPRRHGAIPSLRRNRDVVPISTGPSMPRRAAPQQRRASCPPKTRQLAWPRRHLRPAIPIAARDPLRVGVSVPSPHGLRRVPWQVDRNRAPVTVQRRAQGIEDSQFAAHPCQKHVGPLPLLSTINRRRIRHGGCRRCRFHAASPLPCPRDAAQQFTTSAALFGGEQRQAQSRATTGTVGGRIAATQIHARDSSRSRRGARGSPHDERRVDRTGRAR